MSIIQLLRVYNEIINQYQLDIKSMDKMITSEEIENINSQQFKQYPYRWIITIVYMYSILTVIISCQGVAPIATKVVDIYHISSFQVNMTTISFLIFFILASFPSNYVIDKYGSRIGLLIGMFFAFSGALSNIFININYGFAILGQSLSGISQPFVINCLAKIATFWFSKQKRIIMCTSFMLIISIATSLGYVIPPLIISQDSTGDLAKHQFFVFFLLELILVASSIVLVFFLFKSKPPTYPSLGSKIQKVQFIKSLKILAKNKNFMLLFLADTIFFGAIVAFAILINFLFVPLGFTNLQISQFTVMQIIFGIIGALSIGYLVSKNLKYTITCKILTLFCLFTLFMATLLLYYRIKAFWINSTFLALLGFILGPLEPLTIDLACQIAFPVGQAQITGLIELGPYFFGSLIVLMIQFTSGFDDYDQVLHSLQVLLGFMFIGTILFWLVQNNLIRRNIQQRNSVQPEKEKQGSINQ